MNFVVYTISRCICELTQNTTVCIYTTTGVRSAPMVVYMETAVFLDSLHIHQEMVYTGHVLILFRPKVGGVPKVIAYISDSGALACWPLVLQPSSILLNLIQCLKCYNVGR